MGFRGAVGGGTGGQGRDATWEEWHFHPCPGSWGCQMALRGQISTGAGQLLVQQPWWGIQRGWRAPPQGSGTPTDAGERELVQTPQLSRPNPVFCWQTGIMAITSNKINLVFTPKLLQGLW